MSLIGKKIEKFSLDAFKIDTFLTVTEEDFKGHWSILMFYPNDFSFVCPTELQDLQNQYDKLKEMDVEIFACSSDTHFVHKAWHDAPDSKINSITYTMIGDPAHKLSSMFDCLNEETGLAERATFIIDPNGKIVALEINDQNIGRDASQYINKIKAAKFIASHPGEVCPAKWTENEQTFTPGIDLIGKI